MDFGSVQSIEHAFAFTVSSSCRIVEWKSKGAEMVEIAGKFVSRQVSRLANWLVRMQF